MTKYVVTLFDYENKRYGKSLYVQYILESSSKENAKNRVMKDLFMVNKARTRAGSHPIDFFSIYTIKEYLTEMTHMSVKELNMDIVKPLRYNYPSYCYFTPDAENVSQRGFHLAESIPIQVQQAMVKTIEFSIRDFPY